MSDGMPAVFVTLSGAVESGDAMTVTHDAPQCRSLASFLGAGAQCRLEDGHPTSDIHTAQITGCYSAVDTWEPGRGDTTITLVWQAPVTGMSLYRKDQP